MFRRVNGFIIIFLTFITITSIGCGKKESKSAHNNSPYTTETALKNGDVIDDSGKQYNVDRLEKFIGNINNNKKDKIRITKYTTEGEAIITDLKYDGSKINYIYDSTRDSMGVPTIEKKKFDKNNLYKKDLNYYFKNKSEDVLIF